MFRVLSSASIGPLGLPISSQLLTTSKHSLMTKAPLTVFSALVTVAHLHSRTFFARPSLLLESLTLIRIPMLLPRCRSPPEPLSSPSYYPPSLPSHPILDIALTYSRALPKSISHFCATSPTNTPTQLTISYRSLRHVQSSSSPWVDFFILLFKPGYFLSTRTWGSQL